MWVKANPNPAGKNVPDCVIRAISIALSQPWLRTFDELCDVARMDYNMPSADTVWGHYLYLKGFEPFILPGACPRCVTIREFTRRFPEGIYIKERMMYCERLEKMGEGGADSCRQDIR